MDDKWEGREPYVFRLFRPGDNVDMAIYRQTGSIADALRLPMYE